MRIILLELTGILLAMLLAGLIGRYFAEVSTRPISDQVTKLAAGIVIGMLIGWQWGFSSAGRGGGWWILSEH